jgi:hypothetical protein
VARLFILIAFMTAEMNNAQRMIAIAIETRFKAIINPRPRSAPANGMNM